MSLHSLVLLLLHSFYFERVAASKSSLILAMDSESSVNLILIDSIFFSNSMVGGEKINSYADPGDYEREVMQKVLLTLKQELDSQRKKIFRALCIIQKKVCEIIVDNRNMENYISKTIVKKLNLQTEKHPTPHKVSSLSWIKKGAESKVSEICKVPLAIGKDYVDAVICDVIEMDACHILLGRPWMLNVDAAKSNTYDFV